jgi:CRISPR/Cas system-associated exonuclease Cas4 (RecB family)
VVILSNYSYSRLDLYENCPLAYKYRYIDKRQEAPSEALERGSEVHEWIAAYVKHLIEKDLRTDLDWIRRASANPEAKEILDTYAGTHLLEPGNYVIEKMWKIPLEGHTWWGVIDLLKDEQARVLVTDAKSDHKLRSKTEIDKDRQLKYYAWMSSKKYPKAEEFVCSIDFVRFGVTRSTTYTREDIPKIEQEIIDAIERIEADRDFHARPGTRCAWCSWTSDCPAIAAGDLEVITSADDAERAASQLVAIKARVKYLEDQLKPWCTQEGTINVNGMAVGYHTSKSVSYEIPAMIDVFVNHNLDYWEYIRPDTTAIKKLAAKDGDLAEALEAIAIDKSSSRFEVRKGEA